MNIRALIAIVPLLIVATSMPALAACTSPAGGAGDMTYNSDYSVMQFCNGASWIGMAGGITAPGSGSGITALTGPVTASGSGSVASAITDGAITYAKIQNTSAASVLLGRGSASGAGAVQELTLGSGLSLSGTTLSASASGTVSGTTNYVAKFTSATAVGNSQIFDNGTNVGIGTTSPASVLHVKGVWGGIHGMAEFSSTNASLIRINDQSQTSPAGEWLFGTDNDQFKIYRHNAAGEVNNWVQKLVLDSGGNLGIGTISPLTKLHVSAGDITVENGNAGSGGDGGRIVFRVGAAGDTIGAAAIKSLNTYAGEANGQSGHLAFYTNLRTGTNAYTGLTEKMRITDSGTLLLNNTDGPYGPAKMSIAFAGNTSWGLSIKDTTSSDGAAAMAFWFGNSQVGYVQLHSGSTTYNTTSDRRLKENIADTSRGLAKLEQIKVEDFNFIADPKKTRVQGLIAQDIYTVYPEAVSVGGDDPNKKPWAVDYGRLTPLLIKAVQELKADNDNLRAENAAEIRDLREEIKALKVSIH